MERLTYKNNEGIPFMHYDGISDESTIRQSVIKLATYEDADEQGRLVMLPISIGTVIFYITNTRGTQTYGNRLPRVIKSRKVENIIIGKAGYISIHYGRTLFCGVDDIGKTVFITREEAEAALMRTEENNRNDR